MRIIQTNLSQTAEETQAMLAAWGLLGIPEDMVFFDIETTGFSRLYDSIYLIGLLYVERDLQGPHFVCKQYLAGSTAEEGEILEKALDQLRQFAVCVSFNGDLFDLPFIEERAKRLRVITSADLQWLQERRSVDLLRRYRRYQSFFGWPNMKLKTIEQCLGTNRQDPFSGGQLIEVFHEYACTDDARLEAVLLLHNYEDIIHLPLLLRAEEMMHTLQHGQIEQVEAEADGLLIYWDRPFTMSQRVEAPLLRKKRKDEQYPRAVYRFEAGSRVCSIELPVCEEPLYYFLPEVKDYYYLPGSGEIVHKSLAFDVPAAQRRKARGCECKLCAEPAEAGEGACFSGKRYLQLLPAEAGLRLYQKEYKGAEVYARADELAEWLNALHTEEAAQWARQFFEIL